jgi:DNA-binding NarL/FixJ family response regulator
MQTILIIEDEPEMRRNMVRILGFEGFRTLDAAQGEAGVELARRALPDLVLCDVMMPGLDGYGVLAALRSEASTVNLPFIFLTARSEKADHRQGMDLGADDYLTKPVTADVLLSAVRARLQRAREQSRTELRPNFDSATPLESLGLTAREAEVLLWVAQGKSNADIATLLGTAEVTIKKHLQHVFDKLGVENRHAASFAALRVLSRTP